MIDELIGVEKAEDIIRSACERIKLTYDEDYRKQILKDLIILTQSDGKTHKGEAAILGQVLEVFGLPKTIIGEIIKELFDEQIEKLSNSNLIKIELNTAVITLYTCLISADGLITDSEREELCKCKIFVDHWSEEENEKLFAILKKENVATETGSFENVIRSACERIKLTYDEDFQKEILKDLMILAQSDGEVKKVESFILAFIKESLGLPDWIIDEIRTE